MVGAMLRLTALLLAAALGASVWSDGCSAEDARAISAAVGAAAAACVGVPASPCSDACRGYLGVGVSFGPSELSCVNALRSGSNAPPGIPAEVVGFLRQAPAIVSGAWYL